MNCDNRYCAHNPRRPRGTYEDVMGFICDRCEDREADENEINPVCPVCEIRKDDHGVDFPCEINEQDNQEEER